MHDLPFSWDFARVLWNKTLSTPYMIPHLL